MGASKLRVAPWRSLTDEQCRSHARGRAEVPTSLAGRALALVEWVRGEGAVDGEAPGISRNPQGLWGHDHSGPPYGSAPEHPLAVMGSNDNSSWTRRVGDTHHFNRYEVGGANARELRISGRLIVRGFAPWPKAPYSRGYLRLRTRNTSSGSVTLTVTVRQSNGDVHTTNLTVNSTSWSNRLVASYLRLEPGVNPLDLTFSTSSTAIVTRLSSISINQLARRSH